MQVEFLYPGHVKVKFTELEKPQNVRKAILLHRFTDDIWQEFEHDPECDTDQIDDLLSLCLNQALSQAQAKSTDKDAADKDGSTAVTSDWDYHKSWSHHSVRH